MSSKRIPLTRAQRVMRGHLAGAVSKLGPDDPAVIALRTEFEADRLAQRIDALAPKLDDKQRARLRAVIDAAPPLSDEMADRLRNLLPASSGVSTSASGPS